MRPKIETFRIIAQDYGVDEAFAEKDYWVVNLIKKLSDVALPNGYLAFGGGTSLVKAHRLMKRFSEDVDFRFVSNTLLNRTKKSNIKHIITDYLKTLNEFSLSGKPDARNENSLLLYKLDYPQHEIFSKSDSLRPFIKLEIFFTDIHYPSIKCPISSLYNEYERLEPEVVFDCVAIEDTVIDKISSLLWRIGTDGYEPTDVRHIHDLAMLYDKITIDDNLAKILCAVCDKDMKMRAKTDKTLKESIDNVIVTISENRRYARDYKNYVSNMSYAPDSENMSFELVKERFIRLMQTIITAL